MITKDWSTKVVNIMTHGTEVVEYGCGDICDTVKMLNFDQIQ